MCVCVSGMDCACKCARHTPDADATRRRPQQQPNRENATCSRKDEAAHMKAACMHAAGNCIRNTFTRHRRQAPESNFRGSSHGIRVRPCIKTETVQRQILPHVHEFRCTCVCACVRVRVCVCFSVRRQRQRRQYQSVSQRYRRPLPGDAPTPRETARVHRGTEPRTSVR